MDLHPRIGGQQFAAQTGNVGIEGVRLDFIIEIIDGFLEQRTQHRSALSPQQRFKDEQFPPGQGKKLARNADFTGFEAKLQLTQLRRHRHGAGGSSHQGADAGEKLFDGEGLGQIVIRTEVQALHAVGKRTLRRQYDHRRGDGQEA